MWENRKSGGFPSRMMQINSNHEDKMDLFSKISEINKNIMNKSYTEISTPSKRKNIMIVGSKTHFSNRNLQKKQQTPKKGSGATPSMRICPNLL
jgi:hypothetical protein